MAEVDWTTESAIRLVEAYKSFPELWDPKHEMYRVQSAKYEAWSSLARSFECDIADLRKKLNSIFASHRREKAKIRNGGRSTWFLYPYMSFLPNHLENNVGTVAIQTQESGDNAESSDSDDDADDDPFHHSEITIKEEPHTQEIYVPIEQPPEKRPVRNSIRHKMTFTRPLRPLLKRKLIKDPRDQSMISTLDSRLIETLRLLRKSDLSKRKDECDTFGEYIATSLRKHDERTQSMIKQAINNILFEQEMKKYNTPQYTVVLTNDVDENPLVINNQDDK